MAQTTHVYTIQFVAKMIGENFELIEEIASNSDNINDGEMIHVRNGTERASPPSRTAASKTCRNFWPMSEPGKAASDSSCVTSDVTQS